MRTHLSFSLLLFAVLCLAQKTRAFQVTPRGRAVPSSLATGSSPQWHSQKTTTITSALHLSATAASSSAADLDKDITTCRGILNRAATTKQEDSEAVYTALVDLEKLSRQAAKVDDTYATKMLQNLNGSWRLVFTTGTANTQKKFGKINYFPLKAVQSFDTDNMAIENGIYFGDFCAVRFSGDFTFDLKKRKLEFDFDKICLFQFLDINLKQGQAASLGAKSGLGSESNVELAKKDKSAFFNWISADANVATARGGGGGLALWKRIEE